MPKTLLAISKAPKCHGTFCPNYVYFSRGKGASGTRNPGAIVTFPDLARRPRGQRGTPSPRCRSPGRKDGPFPCGPLYVRPRASLSIDAEQEALGVPGPSD